MTEHALNGWRKAIDTEVRYAAWEAGVADEANGRPCQAVEHQAAPLDALESARAEVARLTSIIDGAQRLYTSAHGSGERVAWAMWEALERGHDA